jgi:hypothetical protein
MTNEQKRFIFLATAILTILIAVSQLFFLTIFETKNFPLRIISICVVWLATCVSYFWIAKIVTEKPKAFVRVFMLQTTVKLFLYMACIVAYLFLYREHGIPFTVHFLVSYIVFAFFEVVLIVKFIKNHPGQTPGSVKK